ncbi:phage tail protein [Actinokineospora sp.]|uniref:phage tail protein n=1 Tax=Actinokineospora sp. TaxID=1872133 RepID=UPI003D6C4DB5
MALPDLDGSIGHSYGLEVDGVRIEGIHEIAGLKARTDAVEVKQNAADGKYVVSKLPGRHKAGEVTFTRAVTADNSFEKWLKDTQFAKTPPKVVAITVYDAEGAPIKRYRLADVTAKSLETASLAAGDTSVLTEKLVVAYERMDAE